jgi:ferredoxin-NADP reductase
MLANERWTGNLKVIKVINETPTVKTFRLANPQGGELPFTFIAGQFLTLLKEIDGKNIKRSYTIASSPLQRDFIEITIKREEFGTISRPLCDQCQEGDEWLVTVPYGHFVFTGKEAPGIVLIGGGVGVTPMMSVFRYLIDTQWSGPIYLLYSYKNYQEYIYRDEIEALCKIHKNIHPLVALTREPEGTPWQGKRGRISREEIIQFIPDLKQCRVHICGPLVMIKECKALALELGVPKEQVKIESFGAQKIPGKKTSHETPHADKNLETDPENVSEA